MAGIGRRAVIFGVIAALGATPAAADKLRVNKRDCQSIIRHNPQGAEYKPGVDAHGRPVKPADVGGGSPITLPKEITIDIGIDLAEKYGLGAGGKYTGEAVVGKVTVKNGRAYWNGKPLDQSEENAIAEACRRQYGTK